MPTSIKPDVLAEKVTRVVTPPPQYYDYPDGHGETSMGLLPAPDSLLTQDGGDDPQLKFIF